MEIFEPQYIIYVCMKKQNNLTFTINVNARNLICLPIEYGCLA